MQKRSSILYKDHGIDVFADAVLGEQFLANVGLQSRESKSFFRIVPNRKIHHRVAVIANSVKKHDSLHEKILPQFSDRY